MYEYFRGFYHPVVQIMKSSVLVYSANYVVSSFHLDDLFSAIYTAETAPKHLQRLRKVLEILLRHLFF